MIDRKLLIVCAAFAIDPFIMVSYNPLVSAFKTSFNVDVTLITLAITFHMLPLAIFSLFFGTISDLYQRPKILVYGLFISSFGSLLGALSPNISIFLFSRSIQGIGSALIVPVALALIGDITPPENIGKAMGFNGMFTAFFSVSLGPLIGGFLGEFNWRFLSLSLCVYALIIGILSQILLRGLEVPQKKGHIRHVFQQIRQTGKQRNIMLLAQVSFISMFAWVGIQSLISDELSLPPLSMTKNEIGTIFSLVGFIGIFFSYFGGILNDKFGGKKNMIFGLLTQIFPVVLLPIASSYGSYLLLLGIRGGFNQLMMTSRRSLMVKLLPKARGSTAAILQFAMFFGFALSPIVMSQLYTSFGIKPLYIVNVFLMLLSTVFVALIRIPHNSH